jgi:hypothetical protein
MMAHIPSMLIQLDSAPMTSSAKKECNVKVDLDYFSLKPHNLHIDSLYIAFLYNLNEYERLNVSFY